MPKKISSPKSGSTPAPSPVAPSAPPSPAKRLAPPTAKPPAKSVALPKSVPVAAATAPAPSKEAAKKNGAAPTKPAAKTRAPARKLAPPTVEEISLRAYFISQKREQEGRWAEPGEDWVEAERQLQAERGL